MVCDQGQRSFEVQNLNSQYKITVFYIYKMAYVWTVERTFVVEAAALLYAISPLCPPPSSSSLVTQDSPT